MAKVHVIFVFCVAPGILQKVNKSFIAAAVRIPIANHEFSRPSYRAQSSLVAKKGHQHEQSICVRMSPKSQSKETDLILCRENPKSLCPDGFCLSRLHSLLVTINSTGTFM